MNDVTCAMRPSGRRVRTSSANGRKQPSSSRHVYAALAGWPLDHAGAVRPAPGARQRVLGEEAPQRLVAEVPRAERRHRPRRVLGEHRHDGVDVAARHRVHVVLDDLAHALVAQRAQRLVLALLGELVVDRLARALQRAVDRRDRRLEQLRASCAEKPSTSRRMSAARWFAGRCCSAAMNASSTVSRCS